MIAIEAIDCGSKLERAVENRRIQDGPVERRCRIRARRTARRLVPRQAGQAGERPVGGARPSASASRTKASALVARESSKPDGHRGSPSRASQHHRPRTPDRQLEGELAQVRLLSPATAASRLTRRAGRPDRAIKSISASRPSDFGDLAHMGRALPVLATVGEGPVCRQIATRNGLYGIQVHGRTPRWKHSGWGWAVALQARS